MLETQALAVSAPLAVAVAWDADDKCQLKYLECEIFNFGRIIFSLTLARSFIGHIEHKPQTEITNMKLYDPFFPSMYMYYLLFGIFTPVR